MYYYWNKQRFFWFMMALIVCASLPAIEEMTDLIAGSIHGLKERIIRRKIQKEFDKIVKASSK